MKKVLSVLLAAAMVMGMSVSSFAATLVFGADTTDDFGTLSLNNKIETFSDRAIIYNSVEGKVDEYAFSNEDIEVNPGDDIYFKLISTIPVVEYDWELVENKSGYADSAITKPIAEPKAEWVGLTNKFTSEGKTDANGSCTWKVVEVVVGYESYKGAIDKDWSINIKGDEAVANAKFYKASTKVNTGVEAYLEDGAQYVKVEIADELESVSTTGTVSFKFYIADNQFTGVKSDEITFYATYKNVGEIGVNYEYTNDADKQAQWKASKAGKAVFDFSDNVFFTVKMVSGEQVVLNMSTAYNKDIDKAYNDNDGDLSFYNFKGSKDTFYRNGDLFIPAEEDTYIYEIVLDKDGEVEEIFAVEDAEWTDEYKVANTSKKLEGWVINTDTLGYYVVSDEELVLPVEEEVEEPATEPEVPAEPEKANPETGAADFVGAAVAMAVVSVAAAGALALKK